ncbi:putative PEP-binding protein [Paenibacillus amylolyticus]|uniref:putative PEP-binding protein n=1 Tax=Paenibacillus amylolyticus TaxID=1451 RepID=UPI003EC0630C
MTKRVLLLEEGTAQMKGLTHSIGAALAELMQAGWSVPVGMIVTTEGSRACCTRLGHLSDEIKEELDGAVWCLEQQTGAAFGDPIRPLLLNVQPDQAVASSSVEQCIIPYVGLNDRTVEGFARQTGNRLYALQCYLVSLQHYGRMVHGIPNITTAQPVDSESYFSGEAELEALIAECKASIQAIDGSPFPQDVYLELQAAVRAVFCSAEQMNNRDDVPEDSIKEQSKVEEPVLIQAVVQGNCADYKGTGKVYTRNPVTGEKGLMGDYLPARSKSGMVHALSYLKRNNPVRYTELEMMCTELEKRTGVVQKLTYVVNPSSICIQFVQPARLSSIAAIRSAVDYVHEGLISKEEAILRLRSEDLTACMQQESPELKRLLEWADEIKELSILAKVEQTAEVRQARAWGAEGIGLCKTETMLLVPSRKPYVQKMVMAGTEAERRRGLERLLPMQQSDIEYLFEVMDGRPVTIQLFDFPLQELWPDSNTVEQQGIHLAIVLSEIHEMQLEAIFRAAVKSIREGLWVRPEIMIPHVEHVQEMQQMRDLADHVAEQVLGEERRHCVYKVGASITTPKAAMTAVQLASYADFVSFDADELTQSTFGCTREEVAERERVVGHAFQLGNNPVHIRDIENVGCLIGTAAAQGQIRKPYLKTSITSEYIQDTASIAFIHDIKIGAVCCRPEQIPWVRVAAAQAVIRASRDKQSVQNEDISTIA